ncbi:MAG: hydantoinase B/oxoprolinase family protein, partial [Candidatus Thorarchaeota archaeon]|nr:hydantoinase B/oxoprolinase family protein [Candidatus Thorarchaeota archaeon]
VSIQSERRSLQPWGFADGLNGKSGSNSIIYEGKIHPLQAKSTIVTPKGTVIRIETPGGGGYGPPPTVKE